MNLATLTFLSRALGKHVDVSVILPERGDGPFPVLLQLHGYSDDHTGWLVKSGLVRHVASYPLIVVLPDGGTSAYLNLPVPGSIGLQRYEDFLMNDLPAQMARTFHVRPGPWAIGGLSMGGFGAMRLGLKYPDRFASIWAHSAAYWNYEELAAEPSYPDRDDADVYAHATRLMQHGSHPTITFDCGVDDRLVSHHRRLHTHMEAIGLPHTFHEHPGGHECAYRPAAPPLLVFRASEIEVMAAD